jgi:hypothetical protein
MCYVKQRPSQTSLHPRPASIVATAQGVAGLTVSGSLRRRKSAFQTFRLGPKRLPNLPVLVFQDCNLAIRGEKQTEGIKQMLCIYLGIQTRLLANRTAFTPQRSLFTCYIHTSGTGCPQVIVLLQIFLQHCISSFPRAPYKAALPSQSLLVPKSALLASHLHISQTVGGLAMTAWLLHKNTPCVFAPCFPSTQGCVHYH